jgi:hypothetical protein
MNWETAFLPGSRPDGSPVLTLLAKGTYEISMGKCEEASESLPLITEDSFIDPQNQIYSDVTAETDLIFHKPSTDVVITGKACAPKGKKAFHLDCSASVGPYSKKLRVYGHRTAKIKAFGGVVISDPVSFEQTEIGYSKAYGGVCKDKNGVTVTFYPNPIGIGFAIKGGIGDDVHELPVPSQEDPSMPVTGDNLVLSKFEDWTMAPKPASLGWTRRNFYPRYTWAGVLPEYLETARKNRDEAAKKYPELADVKIKGMDFRVYQGASEGLWGKQLTGGEPVRLSWLDPVNSEFEFALPREKPVMTFDIGAGPEAMEPVLQTVVIDMDKKLLTMLWRGCLPYGGIEQLADVPKFEYRAV